MIQTAGDKSERPSLIQNPIRNNAQLLKCCRLYFFHKKKKKASGECSNVGRVSLLHKIIQEHELSD